jgi:glyoxylase-like metal-dependent hydrolase (beta-lactamase superfamily II)
MPGDSCSSHFLVIRQRGVAVRRAVVYGALIMTLTRFAAPLIRNTLTSVIIPLLLQPRAAGQNQKLDIIKIAEGVYAAVYSEYRMDPIEGNSLIVVGADGVLVLDSGRTPDSARAMIAEIRKLTDRPVRHVVNSHWHDDHIFGNQAYERPFECQSSRTATRAPTCSSRSSRA